jgi:Cu2+-containing amine oxidase
MDFCVDGEMNSIVEYNAKAETEGPHNPTLNGFYFEETSLDSELQAIRDLSPETARFEWLPAHIDSCPNSSEDVNFFPLIPAPNQYYH